MPQLKLDGVSLHYIFDGTPEGPVLMFANSLGTDLDLWDEQTPVFSALFHTLRYDMRGHGKSSETPGEYTMEELADDALALMDALGVERAHFCGISLGGMVGMCLAERHPERIASLVLCATDCRIGTPEIWEERITEVLNRGMTAIVDTVIERWFTEGFRKREPEKVAEIKMMLLDTMPVGYAGCCAAIRDADLCDALGRLSMPVLCIAGSEDPVIPPDAMQALARRIPGARLEVLEAAHLVNVEARDAFNDTLLRFYAELGVVPEDAIAAG